MRRYCTLPWWPWFYDETDVEKQYFVEAADFDVQVPCFNVTAADFDSTVTATASSVTTTATAASNSSNGLSKGDIAGIAVGTILGSLSIVAAAAYVMFKKRKTAAAAVDRNQVEMLKRNNDAGSVASAP